MAWQAILESATSQGRNKAELENSMYFNVNINEYRDVAYAESKRFLDEYYSSDWPEWKVNVWTGYGSPTECIERLRAFKSAGDSESDHPFPILRSETTTHAIYC
jgi:hypothetical protein